MFCGFVPSSIMGHVTLVVLVIRKNKPIEIRPLACFYQYLAAVLNDSVNRPLYNVKGVFIGVYGVEHMLLASVWMRKWRD